MAYVIQQAPPPTVVIEQPPPPVYVQAPPPQIAMVNCPVVCQSPMKSTPASTFCNLCKQQVVTMTEPTNGTLTWIIFGLLFLLLIWPFCLIPFCVTSCRDIKHICPACKNVIYIYKRM